MNVVFMDDSKRRQLRFKSECPCANLYSTAFAAITALSWFHTGAVAVDALWLDHDLGGEQGCDPARSDTGMEVVRWIIANKPTIKDIVIHSANASASFKMEEELVKAGYRVHQATFADFEESVIPLIESLSPAQ